MRDEVIGNYSRFLNDWRSTLVRRVQTIDATHERFSESYLRLVTLQAWRESIIEARIAPNAFGFFLEAQNDGMISHVQASMGSWRVALKALRSLLENTLLALYYTDHLVELERWEKGTFRIGMSECLDYFGKHPAFEGVSEGTSGMGLLRQQYGKLSEAVHASSEGFRMSAEGEAVRLWLIDEEHESRWNSYERKALQAVNLVLLTFFREQLNGAAFPQLREAVSFVVPPAKDEDIHRSLGVRIRRS